MDFPGGRVLLPVLSTWGLEGLFINSNGLGAATPASAVWPSANLAIYYPFSLPGFYRVRKVWWANGSAVAGNVDAAIFTGGGAKLLSSGSTAQAGTNIVQSVTLGTEVLLGPGSYYMALAASSGSATFLRISSGARQLQRMGVAEQTSAFPLPATFTLAQMTDTYLALCGISRSTVI